MALIETVARSPLRRGDRGPDVIALRGLLTWAGRTLPGGESRDPDLFDGDVEALVRDFQQERGLLADGVVGRQTAVALEGARWRPGDRVLLHTPGHLMRGDDVAALQERMVRLGVHAGRVDGAFGPDTDRSLRELQRGLGLVSDGICGPVTLRALDSLGRAVEGGDPWALRTQDDVAVAGASLAGKVLVLDPAHGGNGYGTAGHGLVEADVTFDVTQRVRRRLAAAGARAILTRSEGQVPDVPARVAVAEEAGADLVLSFHCEVHPSAQASGFATYYWGGRRVGQHSAVGRRLALLVQREVVARTDVIDCRSHPCSYDMVRLTRMPTVLVGLGYLSNPDDAIRLATPDFREIVADAVLAAVQRLYLADDDDTVTGTLDLQAVLEHARRSG